MLLRREVSVCLRSSPFLVVIAVTLAGVSVPACREPGAVCASSDDCLYSGTYSEVCVEGHCRQVCNQSQDCAAQEVCTGGICLPASTASDAGWRDRGEPDRAAALDAALDAATLPDANIPDAIAPDLAPADRPALPDGRRPDASDPDTARADASPVDAAQPDAAVADTAQPEAAQLDVAQPDAAQPDRPQPDMPPPDAAQPDRAGPDRAPSPCGNSALDPGEACDGQLHCGDDCQPEPGFTCAENLADELVCFGVFPTGAPSHIGALPAVAPADLPAVVLDCDAQVSTDEAGASTRICGVDIPSVTTAQARGPETRVFSVRELEVRGELRFVGSRAPAIVVFGDATVIGSLDVGADGTISGPGAHYMCGDSAGSIGVMTGDCGGGGGGGGNGSAGGAGGGLPQYDEGQAGSGASGGLVHLPGDVLSGGCPGGEGNKDSQLSGTLPPGGAGGGALQISTAGSLEIGGRLIADGAGGTGGYWENKSGGGGGGSGGTLFLEARQLVSTPASFVLTGGGGGQGATRGSADRPASGEDGVAGRLGGAGGDGAVAGRAGGAGGGLGEEGSPGLDGYQDPDDIAGGGGGGGGGRLVTMLLSDS